MRIIKFVLLFFLSLTILILGSFFVYYKNYIPNLNTNTSFLILGVGGEGHTGPDLTDTIMLVTLYANENKISILSLPRDIWVPEIRAKLNSAYHYGGNKMVGESVYSITGVKPEHFVIVDFSLFKELIDTIGGIEVFVDNGFIDEKYPIAGKENDLCDGDKTYSCRYETLRFDQGNHLMTGDLALKFVRSRNAVGDEGTDLAREKRQQKVILALKEKIFSKDVLLSPKTIKNIYFVLVSHISQDFSNEDLYSLIKFFVKAKNSISTLSIPEEMIEVSQNNKKYDFQYVFIPKSGNWLQFKEWLTSQPN